MGPPLAVDPIIVHDPASSLKLKTVKLNFSFLPVFHHDSLVNEGKYTTLILLQRLTKWQHLYMKYEKIIGFNTHTLN